MPTVDTAWLDARIARQRTLIQEIENAIEVVAINGQSYTLDTGQTRTTVTRSNMGELKNALTAAEERLEDLRARRERTGGFIARPGF